jgi:DNA repair protein RecN (Recombination protein N)
MVGVASKNSENRSKLEELSIRNLGVIEEGTIEFSSGLNVLTGETGAGKTMVITALSLVSGGKSDLDLIRKGSDKLIVSGRFKMPSPSSENLTNLMIEHEPDVEDQTLLLMRTVAKDGKSKAMLASTPTTATTLAKFADEFIEIHGQHGALSLTKPARQRELLDSFASKELEDSWVRYQKIWRQYFETRRRLSDLEKSEGSRQEKISELEVLVKESNKLNPRINEIDDLENRIAMLESVEDIRISLSEALMNFSEDEIGVVTRLSNAKRALSTLNSKDERFKEFQKRVEGAFFEVSDLTSELSSFLEELESDPAALEIAQTRKTTLRNFARKYGGDGDANEQLKFAIERAKAASTEIADLTGGKDRVTDLQMQIVVERKALVEVARELSAVRSEAAKRFSKLVEKELSDLALQNSRFSCGVFSGDPAKDESFSESGIDIVEMRFTAHSGGELLPITKAASGGELSRLMLAIEVVAAESAPLGTYLFDEIDAGIGGKAALEVGRRLKRLSKGSQVIVVTHLPQVAIWADRHLKVEKDSSGAISESSISVLTDNQREAEIARMLSGISESEHAQEHARELLNLGKS